jgi:hypothetical protein
MNCDLILDETGAWWLQWKDAKGRPHTRFIDALDQADAESEAHRSGFDEMTIFHEDEIKSRVTIPKRPFP